MGALLASGFGEGMALTVLLVIFQGYKKDRFWTSFKQELWMWLKPYKKISPAPKAPSSSMVYVYMCIYIYIKRLLYGNFWL